jgi:hypothetical protein
MTNIILALFIVQPGTPVTLINPPKYKDCRGVIIEYNEVKDVVYYDVKLFTCADVKLKYLRESDFTTP